jgi:hypothetical protein
VAGACGLHDRRFGHGIEVADPWASGLSNRSFRQDIDWHFAGTAAQGVCLKFAQGRRNGETNGIGVLVKIERAADGRGKPLP